jgi:hypothetical protein
VIVVGVGELAGPFSLGFLRLDYPVYPVTRETDRAALASELPMSSLTLVMVREADLDDALGTLPAPWRHSVCLVQNDLVPAMWQAHHLEPTVAVVWFEKKPSTAINIIRPTIVGGPEAALVVDALGAVGIPAEVVDDPEDLVIALVVKNTYIGVANIAGLDLEPGTTVGELWADHRELATAVADDVLAVQQALVERPVDRDRVIAEMADTFAADPNHGAMGRSASDRLQRAIDNAARLGLDVPTLQRIARLG